MLGPACPVALGVRDGIVRFSDRRLRAPATSFHLWMRDTTRFRVLHLDGRGRQAVPRGRRRRARRAARRPRTSALADHRARRSAESACASSRSTPVTAATTSARAARASVLEKNVNARDRSRARRSSTEHVGVTRLLTRDGDYFIPLRERYRIAETDEGRPVHQHPRQLVASVAARGSGTEVYFLSLRGASDQADAGPRRRRERRRHGGRRPVAGRRRTR